MGDPFGIVTATFLPVMARGALPGGLEMSVVHLHRLFKSEPHSPSHSFRNRRLDACSRDLPDSCRGKAAVAKIAFDRGFNDAANFSREFRERFHCLSRKWRMQGVVSALD